MQEHVAHEGKNPYNGIKNVGIEPTTEVRAPPWLTLSFFIYITAKPVGYIYPKEISINTVKFLYQTIAHLDSSMALAGPLHGCALHACMRALSAL